MDSLSTFVPILIPKDDLDREAVIVFNYGLVCSNFHWEKQIPFF